MLPISMGIGIEHLSILILWVSSLYMIELKCRTLFCWLNEWFKNFYLCNYPVAVAWGWHPVKWRKLWPNISQSWMSSKKTSHLMCLQRAQLPKIPATHPRVPVAKIPVNCQRVPVAKILVTCPGVPVAKIPVTRVRILVAKSTTNGVSGRTRWSQNCCSTVPWAMTEVGTTFSPSVQTEHRYSSHLSLAVFLTVLENYILS